MKKADKSSSAGTDVESSTNVQVEHVSQPIAKPNVVGSLFVPREKKFRAWHTGEKTWWFFDFFDLMSGHTDIVDNRYRLKYRTEYTGLKDKSGKEIYEGDRIKMTNKRTTWYGIKEFTGIVEFDNSLQYIVRHKSDWIDLANPDYDIEVIGNIFENPELLQSA